MDGYENLTKWSKSSSIADTPIAISNDRNKTPHYDKGESKTRPSVPGDSLRYVTEVYSEGGFLSFIVEVLDYADSIMMPSLNVISSRLFAVYNSRQTKPENYHSRTVLQVHWMQFEIS